jgi:hypothetical protein
MRTPAQYCAAAASHVGVAHAHYVMLLPDVPRWLEAQVCSSAGT